MYNLLAKLPQQQVCRERQYGGLLRWAAYIGALPVPTEKPDEQFVANKLLAQRIPTQITSYVEQTLSLTAADPTIQQNIREHLNGFNDEATEGTMDSQVDAALGAGLPLVAKTQIGDSEIQKWYEDNGFVESPPVARRGMR